jgi:uncharacterized protein YjiS (DUF1127 family)
MFLSTIWAKFRAWRRSRQTIRELSRLSDRELKDLGITRFDLQFVAKRQGSAWL